MSDPSPVPTATPPPPAAPAAPRTSTYAIISLVAGLLTWFSLPLFFLVLPTPLCAAAAIVCGHIARAEIRRDRTLQGDGLALGGLVLGWSMVLLTVFAIVAVVVFFGGLAAFLAWAGVHGQLH
jgi:hypothetical protein